MHRQILRCDEVTVDNSLSAGMSLTTKRIAPLHRLRKIKYSRQIEDLNIAG